MKDFLSGVSCRCLFGGVLFRQFRIKKK